jgi:hypothetical protein
VSDLSFDRDELRALLTEVADVLEARGIRAELFIVGGAAIALAFNARRLTADVGGVFEPKSMVYEAAAEVAAARGLRPDWLNDAVKGLLPGTDPDAREVLDLPGLRVSVPSARYLLALKVQAARVDRDTDDIRLLAQLCGATTAHEVLAIAEDVIGRKRLLPKAQFVVQELFPELPASSSPPG